MENHGIKKALEEAYEAGKNSHNSNKIEYPGESTPYYGGIGGTQWIGEDITKNFSVTAPYYNMDPSKSYDP